MTKFKTDKYLSREEMYLLLDGYDKNISHYNKTYSDPDINKIDRSIRVIFGFNVVHTFVETELGWLKMYETCCPYALHSAICLNGTRADRKKFNLYQTLGEDYRVPVTHKEQAKHNKMQYKRYLGKRGKMKRKGRRKYLERPTNKEHQKFLLRLQAFGISTLRRTKGNCRKDLIPVVLGKAFREEKALSLRFGMYVYVKGVVCPHTSYRHVSNERDLREYVQKIIDNHNFKNNQQIPMPDNLVIV